MLSSANDSAAEAHTTVDHFELHSSIEVGQSGAQILKLLRESGDRWRDPGLRNHRGDAAIHVVAKSNKCNERKEILGHLLRHYTNTHTEEDEAAKTQKIQDILMLRDSPRGDTLLHLAARCRRYQLVKHLLVDLGANRMVPNHEGWLPIHYIAEVSMKKKKDGDLAAELLARHMITDGLAKYRLYAPGVFTPEQLAAQSACPQVLKLFGERGFEFYPHRQIPLLHLVVTNQRGDVDDALTCAEYLLEGLEEEDARRGDVNAVSEFVPGQHPEQTRVPEVNICTILGRNFCRGQTFTQNTALHLAAHRGLPKILRLLLVHGANPSAVNSIGLTPLHLLVDAWTCLEPNARQDPLGALLSPEFHIAGGPAMSRVALVMTKLYRITEAGGGQRFGSLAEVDVASSRQESVEELTLFDLCLEDCTKKEIIESILRIMADEFAKSCWLGQPTLGKLYSEDPLLIYPLLDGYEARNAEPASIIDFSIITGHVGEDPRHADGAQPATANLHKLLSPKHNAARHRFLKHSFVKSYLERRWKKFELTARSCAVVQFMILLSYLVLLVFLHDGGHLRLEVYSGVYCLLLVLLFLKEMVQLWTARKAGHTCQYFSAYNVSQIIFCLLALGSIIVIQVIDQSAKSVFWSLLLSVAGVASVWTVAILQLKNLPRCGKYVSILLQVTWKSLKIFALFGAPTLVAFTAAFFLLFQKSPLFSTAAGLTGPVKVFAMMVGEFTFDELFNGMDIASRPLPLLTFTLFVFISTIVLLNLLIAIAVDVTNEIKENADMELRISQLEQIHQWEQIYQAKNTGWTRILSQIRMRCSRGGRGETVNHELRPFA